LRQMVFCWHNSEAIAYLLNILLYNLAAQQLMQVKCGTAYGI